jgi:hypothetical protein
MKVFLILILFLFLSFNIFAEDGKKTSEKKVIYKYKQYEKFDFDDLSVEGEDGSPGDLSINPRFQKEFKNELPYRKNFKQEMIKSLDTVK